MLAFSMNHQDTPGDECRDLHKCRVQMDISVSMWPPTHTHDYLPLFLGLANSVSFHTLSP